MIVNLLTRILDHISVQDVGGDSEMNIKLLNGNVLDMLKTIADESVDCVVSSPPYYGLRSYIGADTIWGGNPDCEHEWVGYIRKGQNGGKNSDKLNIKKSNEQNFQLFEDQKQNICHKCGAWKGQLGLEPKYEMYIDHLMLVMKELKRVLKKTGTLFWNMGDSYAGDMGSRAGWQDSKYSESREEGINNGEAVFLKADYGNIQAKSLMMIPERFAIAMIDGGWFLRNSIIWYKRNGMPSSVKDRLSNKWEYVFFFTKSQKYYFNLDSIRKPLEESSIKRISQKNIPNQFKSGKSVEFAKTDPVNNIPKIVNNMHQKYQQDRSYQGSHSGYFNDDGSLRANLSGANPGDVVVHETVEFFRQKGHGGNFDYDGINSENVSHYNQHGVDPGDVISQPAVRHKSWASNPGHEFTHERKYDPDADGGDFFNIPTRAHSFAHFAVFPETLVEPLIKAGCPSNGIVLDPFAGSGTVGVVAMKQEKNAILVEISPEYCNIIKKRLNWDVGLGVKYEHVGGEALK